MTTDQILVWVNSQMPQDTREKLDAIAEKENRSRSSTIRWLIELQWTKLLPQPKSVKETQ